MSKNISDQPVSNTASGLEFPLVDFIARANAGLSIEAGDALTSDEVKFAFIKGARQGWDARDEEVKLLRDVLKATVKHCGSDFCTFPSCGCHDESKKIVERLREKAQAPDVEPDTCEMSSTELRLIADLLNARDEEVQRLTADWQKEHTAKVDAKVDLDRLETENKRLREALEAARPWLKTALDSDYFEAHGNLKRAVCLVKEVLALKDSGR